MTTPKKSVKKPAAKQPVAPTLPAKQPTPPKSKREHLEEGLFRQARALYEFNHEQQIVSIKQRRVDLDAILQSLKTENNAPTTDGFQHSKEVSLAITKIQEAIMWLGMELKRLNGGRTIYPNSYKPENTKIEPCADGLKL